MNKNRTRYLTEREEDETLSETYLFSKKSEKLQEKLKRIRKKNKLKKKL